MVSANFLDELFRGRTTSAPAVIRAVWSFLFIVSARQRVFGSVVLTRRMSATTSSKGRPLSTTTSCASFCRNFTKAEIPLLAEPTISTFGCELSKARKASCVMPRGETSKIVVAESSSVIDCPNWLDSSANLPKAQTRLRRWLSAAEPVSECRSSLRTPCQPMSCLSPQRWGREWHLVGAPEAIIGGSRSGRMVLWEDLLA